MCSKGGFVCSSNDLQVLKTSLRLLKQIVTMDNAVI